MNRAGSSRSNIVAVSTVLLLLTLASYGPLLQSSFINLDDHQYVTDNPHVRSGISWENFVWAFRTTHASNWHPLTWVSHQLDVQLFGLNPGWHHLTNLLFHIANSFLLFRLLRVVTGTCWRSAFVAALFALHPAHVESVAWISERKDVLSAFFFFLSLLAYSRYVEQTKETRALQSTGLQLRTCAPYFLLSFFLFALGLMSKPMLVTLPFVLLLLDYWPFGRWRGLLEQQGRVQPKKEAPFSQSRRLAKRAALLFVEKLPFIGLSIASCLMTFRAQNQGHAVVSGIPFEWRSANALASYAKYLGKAFWPSNLSIFYPYPTSTLAATNPWSWDVVLSATLLSVISFLAILRLKREPWFATGWFWFLGTLVPVIGLVQVGNQAMADRYTYIPFIGIFIIVAWFAAGLLEGRCAIAVKRATSTTKELSAPGAPAAMIVIVLACSIATRAQVRHWNSNIAIFEHSVAVTKNNATAHFNLGADYALHQDFERAIPHLRTALEIDPAHSDAHVGLGAILAQQGNADAAIAHFREGIKTRPWNAVAHNSLGSVLMHQGKKQEAIEEYREAASLAPNFFNAHNNLGLALAEEGKLEEAEAQFNAAIRCDPLSDLAHFALANVLDKQAKWEAAISEYYTVLRLNPTNMAALNNFAWLRAANPEGKYRNGSEAVKLAEQACRLSDFREPQLIGTLAAAYAEAGRFDEAVDSAAKAAKLARTLRRDAIAARNTELLNMYRAGKPYHEQRK
jgi:tetratricopeptide (TPR) repeat protein